MARYPYQSFIQDGNGRAVEGVTVTVYDADTTTGATIYAAKTGGSAITGSYVTTSASGYFIFYVDAPDWPNDTLLDLVPTKSGYSFDTISDVAIYGEGESNYYYPEYGADDQGATGDSNTIKYYVDTIGATNKATIYLQHNDTGEFTDYSFSTAETITSNITLMFEPGARLAIGTGITVTIQGDVDSGLERLFSLTGTGVVVFGSGAIKEISPEWWGAKADDSTNSTTALQAAITCAYASGIGRIVLQSGTYIYSTKLTSYRGVHLEGDNTNFKVSTCAATGAVLDIENNANCSCSILQVVTGIKFIGHLTSEAGYAIGSEPDYTSGLNGINFKTSLVTVEGCSFVGFDKAVTFGSTAHNIDFIKVFFRMSNYGVYFTQTGFTDLGENITFYHCVLGNNNYGVYNSEGMLKFIGSSFDYNRYHHVKDNITISGGQLTASMRLIGCHIENTTVGNSDSLRIVNTGLMSLESCDIWDDYTDYIIESSDTSSRLILDNILWRYGVAGNYLIDDGSGVGKVINKNSIYLSDSEINLLTPNLCNVTNNGAEAGDLTGWTQTHGTCTSSATKSKNGSKSFKLIGEAFASATLTSDKHPVQMGAQFANLSVWANTYETTLTGDTYLYTYDSAGVQLDAIHLQIPVSVDAFTFYITGYTAIDRRSFSYAVELVTGTSGITEIGYVDDINVQFI